MRPRPRELSGAALLLAALGAAAGCGGDARERVNVVVVSVDTLRRDSLGAYGGVVETPAFDRLAEEGVLAEVALAPAPETAPSHATLFSGREVARHRVTRNGVELETGLPTLAEAFHAAGYSTGAFVSSFVLDPRFGWGRGFDHYDSEFSETGATLTKERTYPGAFWAGESFGGFDRRADETTDAVLRWLDRARPPFFLFVHYFDPHLPYVAPAEFERRTAESPVDLTDRGFPGVGGQLMTRLIRRYRAEVLFTDRQLGRLIDALHADGRAGRTLLVVTADHGEGLGDHQWIEHGVYLYDELVRVPLIFHWPGRLPAGRRIQTPMGLVDVAPTVAALAGIAFPPGFDGRSVAAELESGAEPAPRDLLGHARAHGELSGLQAAEKLSVRSGRWKYIRIAGHPDELYDLAEDPGERRNVRALHDDVVARLGAVLDERQVLAPTPRPATPLSDETRRGLEALGYVE